MTILVYFAGSFIFFAFWACGSRKTRKSFHVACEWCDSSIVKLLKRLHLYFFSVDMVQRFEMRNDILILPFRSVRRKSKSILLKKSANSLKLQSNFGKLFQKLALMNQLFAAQKFPPLNAFERVSNWGLTLLIGGLFSPRKIN